MLFFAARAILFLSVESLEPAALSQTKIAAPDCARSVQNAGSGFGFRVLGCEFGFESRDPSPKPQTISIACANEFAWFLFFAVRFLFWYRVLGFRV